jgi:hypothetical protein
MITAPAVLRQLARYFRRHQPPHDTDLIDGSAVLAKASVDQWEYLVGLRTGLIVHCAELSHRDGWILLRGVQDVLLTNGRKLLPGEFVYGRGIEVRVSEVAWVADCDS